MHLIDASSLEHRIQSLRDFIAFSNEDAAVLNASKTFISPLIASIVEAVFIKLKALSHEHPLECRKDHLTGYIMKFFTLDYKKNATWEYLENVRLTDMGVRSGPGQSRTKPGLTAEFVRTVLLGYIEETLVETIIAQSTLEPNTRQAVLGCVIKVFWIQNELLEHNITRGSLGSVGHKNATTTVPASKTIAGSGLIALGNAFTQVLVPHL